MTIFASQNTFAAQSPAAYSAPNAPAATHERTQFKKGEYLAQEAAVYDRLDLIGVGSPIMDLLAHVDDAFLREHVAGEKGGMVLVEDADIADLVAKLTARAGAAAGAPTPNTAALAAAAALATVPGGAAANTTLVAAKLGLHTAFLGKVGADATATRYLANFREHGADTTRFKHAPAAPNARCLSLVTPDGQRTMRTHLGAAMTLAPAEIRPEDFAHVRHAHIEGYLLFNPALANAVLAAARAAGCTISLDLASFEVVAAARDWIFQQLEQGIDLLFANEDEARALLQDQAPHAQRALALARYGGIAAVKVGAEGAWVASAGGDVLHRINPMLAPRVVDTTGAGDAWAGAFLYAHLHGSSIPTAGALGSLLGAETVQHLGAAIPAARWPAIRAAANELLARHKA